MYLLSCSFTISIWVLLIFLHISSPIFSFFFFLNIMSYATCIHSGIIKIILAKMCIMKNACMLFKILLQNKLTFYLIFFSPKNFLETPASLLLTFYFLVLQLYIEMFLPKEDKSLKHVVCVWPSCIIFASGEILTAAGPKRCLVGSVFMNLSVRLGSCCFGVELVLGRMWVMGWRLGWRRMQGTLLWRS